jgi:hypothetical protein
MQAFLDGLSTLVNQNKMLCVASFPLSLSHSSSTSGIAHHAIAYTDR